MKKLALTIFAGLSFSGFAHASQLQLRSVQTNGSGCPTAVYPSIPFGFDGEWLTFDLQRVVDMEALRGPGISLEESRRQCAFTLDMKAPQGYRFALERVLLWGNAQLAPGDQLNASTDTFLAGNGATSETDYVLEGNAGRNGPFFADSWIPANQQIWSDCRNDRALTINSALRIGGQHGMRQAQYSAADLSKIAFRFVLQRCR